MGFIPQSLILRSVVVSGWILIFNINIGLLFGYWGDLKLQRDSYIKRMELLRGGSRIFLGGGAPPRNGATDWWPDVNTSCIRKRQVISGEGAHPLHPPPRPAPATHWKFWKEPLRGTKILFWGHVFSPLRGTNSGKITLSPAIVFQLNTLKGTAKALTSCEPFEAF